MERFIFIFLFGFLLFSWPILEIFKNRLVIYLYGMWLVYIIVLALAVRKSGGTRKSTEAGEGGNRG